MFLATRFWRTVPLVCCLALLLSSCILAENPGMARIGVVDDQLVVAICIDDRVTSLRVSKINAGDSRLEDWHDIWEANGIETRSGQSIILDESHLVDDISASALIAEGGADYNVVTTFENSPADSSLLRMPQTPIADGQWLFPSGRVSDAPC